MTKRYTIERKLGEGASATVFLATDTLTNQAVAIKRALEVMARHARFAGRWQREVIVLQTLQHPCVVPLIDATFAKGKPLGGSSASDSPIYIYIYIHIMCIQHCCRPPRRTRKGHPEQRQQRT